ncbi:ATP-binding cassette domain-containing protein [Anoxybacillus sp. FSL W8-0104]|uniref:ATP-binding cassette domain-containing protein n=1 Tax=Anoxybacillus sp. FSL W8-0703 TaxID=2954704 RepID=UPI0030F9AB2C
MFDKLRQNYQIVFDRLLQNGSGISGGQAQIIAFLRAIIKKRDLIILDEATSNLDADTKKLILEILKESDLCNILIIISHEEEGPQFINKIIQLQHNKPSLEKTECVIEHEAMRGMA